MHGVATTRRDVVGMDARLAHRRDALHGHPLREIHAIQIALRRIVGGGDVIHPSTRHIDVFHGEDVEVAGRQLARRTTAARNEEQMIPAAALRHPQDVLVTVHESQVIELLDPSAVLLGEQGAHGSRLRIGQQHLQRILKPVEMLDNELPAPRSLVCRHPRHARDVMLARIARHGHPARVAACRTHDADATRRIRLSRLGILHGRDVRVE